MTSHVGRLYALALALVVFFLAWAAIAARPWATATPDPRLPALGAREAQLRHEATLVRQLVAPALGRLPRAARARTRRSRPRSTPLRRAARRRRRSAPARPPVRVVTLPPLTITRTS